MKLNTVILHSTKLLWEKIQNLSLSLGISSISAYILETVSSSQNLILEISMEFFHLESLSASHFSKDIISKE